MWRRALLLLVPLAVAAGAVAQERPGALGSPARVNVGAGFGPGFGVVGQATSPVLDVFTREVVVYADYVPRVTGGSGRLVTALGVGAGVRLVRLYDVVQNRDGSPLGIDVGLRIGPSFYTAFFEQTAESRSRAFSVMLDPFGRVTLRRPSGRVFFAEVGTQGPALRAGLSTSFRVRGL